MEQFIQIHSLIQKYVLSITYMAHTSLSDMGTIRMIQRKPQPSGSLHAMQTLQLN